MHPYTTFTIGQLSKFFHNPGLPHWDTTKHIFYYLSGMKDYWLTYGDRDKNLTGCIDADESQGKNQCAITGYAFLIDGGAVYWNLKQQEEALWLCLFFSKVFGHSLHLPPSSLTINPQSHFQRTTNIMCEQSTLTSTTTSFIG